MDFKWSSFNMTDQMQLPLSQEDENLEREVQQIQEAKGIDSGRDYPKVM